MITLEDARRIITAAEKKADEIGQPMNIAVADAGGNFCIPHQWLDDFDRYAYSPHLFYFHSCHRYKIQCCYR